MVWPFGKKEKKAVTSGVGDTERKAPFVDKNKQLHKLLNDTQNIGVKIIRCGCDASLEIMDKTFLFNESVPTLPLENCSNPNKCNCQYLGLRNRREKPDRRVQRHDRRDSMRLEDDRRKNHGRREDDASRWDNYQKL